MKKIDTGCAPGNRMLDAIVAFVARGCPHLLQDWLAGDLEIDLNFRFLGAKTGIRPADVPTVLAFLHAAGYVRARFDINPNHCARISLRLPAGATLQ